MPPRRIFRRKQRTEPMTSFIWQFFLARRVEDFDRLAAAEGDDASTFYFLYYSDGWRVVYEQHRSEIESEWKRRRWPREQRRFVLTPYGSRGITLAHDARSEHELELWEEWRAREGWKTESFPEHVSRMKEGDS